MAKGIRGKLKENLEGVHRNCEWIKQHCDKSVLIIPDDDRYKNLIESFISLAEIANTLDELSMGIYSKI